jgi:hypothetical protein
MRRIRYALLFLTVSLMVLLGNALPALARHRGRRHRNRDDGGDYLRDPQCGWYENWNRWEEWWEYWCYWPNWGWEFVFWSW